jgi:hypothetical protein
MLLVVGLIAGTYIGVLLMALAQWAANRAHR